MTFRLLKVLVHWLDRRDHKLRLQPSAERLTANAISTVADMDSNALVLTVRRSAENTIQALYLSEQISGAYTLAFKTFRGLPLPNANEGLECFERHIAFRIFGVKAVGVWTKWFRPAARTLSVTWERVSATTRLTCQ